MAKKTEAKELVRKKGKEGGKWKKYRGENTPWQVKRQEGTDQKWMVQIKGNKKNFVRDNDTLLIPATIMTIASRTF